MKSIIFQEYLFDRDEISKIADIRTISVAEGKKMNFLTFGDKNKKRYCLYMEWLQLHYRVLNLY